MDETFDLLVAGEINPDLILSGSDIEPRFGQQEILVEASSLCIGSSSAILACGAARLGLYTAFIGVAGDDLFGHFMLEAIQARQVNVSSVIIDPRQQTGLSVILNRGGDRAILTYPGCIAALRADQVSDELLKQARHLHIASYFLQTALQPDLPDLLRRAHFLGLTTSLDTNWDPSGEWQAFDRLLSLVDVFLPNENEALALTQSQSVEQALERLSLHCQTVAIKLGAQGGIARQGQETAQAPALKVEIMDTIGAGDSFDSGFLYGYLNGWDLARCLRLGTVCGSLSMRAAGGVNAQPTLPEAMAYIDAWSLS